jgi:protein-disulfide isomerase
MIKPPRILILVTTFILIALSGTVYSLARTKLPPSIVLNIKGQPTIGYPKARVHVVVFEEPKCSHCGAYNREIFPVIKKEFIDTNKIQYTTILVAFLPGSMPAAIAALCVYNENSLYPNDELFFKYLDNIYRNQPKKIADWATEKNLMNYAQATSPAISLDELKSCIDKETYRVRIEENTAYGKQIMGGTVITPTVYVNGIAVRDVSEESIRDLINKVLEHEGVY